MRVVRKIDAKLTAEEDILDVAWVMGRSAPAFYYNMVGDRDQAPAFAQALIRHRVSCRDRAAAERPSRQPAARVPASALCHP